MDKSNYYNLKCTLIYLKNEIVNLFKEHLVGPVVEDSGALIRIVTMDDLIAKQLKDLSALIGKQQNSEKKYR